MTDKNCYDYKLNKIKLFLYDENGSSLPMVMLVGLVVIIICGAVAYSAVQLFSIIRKEAHNQYTYIAAESAIERSFCNLDSIITKPNFATSRGIPYINNDEYVNEILTYLNNVPASDVIKKSFDVGVYTNMAMNKANVDLKFELNGDVTDNGNTITIPIKITSTARMVNGLFHSYGRKVVATRSFKVYKPYDFELNGAVYTLGDLVARGNEKSVIKGDVYAFGTGISELKKMQQYYNGGICAVDSATLHIHEGSAYTASLVRAGIFNEPLTSASAKIIIDDDVVAQGIQVFGNNDSIVVLRDAYTFDDIEMNGANSIIAINRNFFGLNYGDFIRHDTSSGVLNVAPVYGQGFFNEFLKSRIVINKHILVNGTNYRIVDPITGQAGHTTENVGYAWNYSGTFPISPIYQDVAENESSTNYQTFLRGKKSTANGFSVLINANWGSDAPDLNPASEPPNKEEYLVSEAEQWINKIRSSIGADYITNNVSFNDITGYCSFAIAANNSLYLMDLSPTGETTSEIKRIPSPLSDDTIKCSIAEDVKSISSEDFWDIYCNGTKSWTEYTSTSPTDNGVPTGLTELLYKLKAHVYVLAGKSYDENNTSNNVIDYSLAYGPNGPLMLSIGDYLDSEIPLTNKYVLRYDDSMDQNVISELEEKYNDDTDGDGVDDVFYTDYFILVLNLDPTVDLIIDKDMKGIVFTLGKLTIESDDTTETTVTGAVLAAGRGYNPDDPKNVIGSAAQMHSAAVSRLPRVNITSDPNNSNDNRTLFDSWGYAALELKGANIEFPGRNDLLDEFLNQDPFGDGKELFEVLDAVF